MDARQVGTVPAPEVICQLSRRDMTDALSSMEYPHWLIIAGAILLMLGLVGLHYVHEALKPTPAT